MKPFDEAWDVLKMGTYEEEEADMGYMPGRPRRKPMTPDELRRLMAIQAAMKRGPPYGNEGGKPERHSPYESKDPSKSPYDPYRDPPKKPFVPKPFVPQTPRPGSPYEKPYPSPNPYDPKKPSPYGGGGPDRTCPKCGHRYKARMSMITGLPEPCPMCQDNPDGGATPNPYGPPPGAPPNPMQPMTNPNAGFPEDFQRRNMSPSP